MHDEDVHVSTTAVEPDIVAVSTLQRSAYHRVGKGSFIDAGGPPYPAAFARKGTFSSFPL